jgi:hypothetical protein
VIFRNSNHPNADISEKVLRFIIIVANLKNSAPRVFRQNTRKIYSGIATDIRLLLNDDGERLNQIAVEAQSVLIDDEDVLLAAVAGLGGCWGGGCHGVAHGRWLLV